MFIFLAQNHENHTNVDHFVEIFVNNSIDFVYFQISIFFWKFRHRSTVANVLGDVQTSVVKSRAHFFFQTHVFLFPSRKRFVFQISIQFFFQNSNRFLRQIDCRFKIWMCCWHQQTLCQSIQFWIPRWSKSGASSAGQSHERGSHRRIRDWNFTRHQRVFSLCKNHNFDLINFGIIHQNLQSNFLCHLNLQVNFHCFAQIYQRNFQICDS